ncbi:MAG: hypothetical protein JST85_27885 [Acidobacteria bacterium]|nr:hypothetical protein [Acidobacteriota bacterium]
MLEEQITPFFDCLNRLLSNPVPYHAIGNNWVEETFAEDRYFTVQIWLAELAGFSPVPRKWDKALTDRIARIATLWLRMPGQSTYAPIANAYFELLDDSYNQNNRDNEAEFVDDHGPNELFTDADQSLAPLANLREEPHGEEFYQTMRLTIEAWQCESLRDLSKFRDEFAPLFELESPLRPQIVMVFRRLRDAAVDAASFLTAEHELTRKNALLKAGGVLEEARQLANQVYEPERSLLFAVIEHWRRMFAIEGGRVAEREEVEILPNPYVAGRPIRPEDGQLFAGRREEMKLIEEKLQTGVGIVIWGQRRIGKTSILLHLRQRLPHDLLPVYLNLQLLMANTTGGFLYAVAREIVKQLSGVQSPGFSRNTSNAEAIPPKGGTLNAPSADEFTREPYLSFNHLLEEIERQLQPGQRVLLSFDEFEELEQRVKDGKIEKEIFAYLRGVTQTGNRFAMLFAGLHTLEEMTHEYWNPFFASVQTIRVGYLSELDAEQLIRDPIEQFPLSYELESVNRITELTNSHAYLVQSVCHNLVNRLNDPLNRGNNATREDVDAVLERTLESSGYYFDDFVWGWSNEQERIALALLAEVEGEASFSVVEKHLGREAALAATRALVARDILSERTSEAGELVFRFEIPLAQMWVKEKKPSARILMEGGKL